MATEQILITVRTYPSPSREYVELVCTGGVTQNGEWRRLFPVPLRYMDEGQQFRTYDIIETKVAANKQDSRPESRRPDLQTLRAIGHLKEWSTRCEWINPTILPSLKALKDAGKTLAPVAARRVIDLEIEDDSPDWTPAQLQKLQQQQLFQDNKPLEKVPYKFRFLWQDEDGTEQRSRIISWEMNETWRRWRHQYDNTLQRLKDKFLNEVCGESNKVSFFMGNYHLHPQHFAVTGIFHPPKSEASHGNLWQI